MDTERGICQEDADRVYQKLDALEKEIEAFGSLAVAFSGGVDSAFLLEAAHRALGGRVLALTAKSEFFPGREFREAEEFCRTRGIRHKVLETKELDVEGVRQNPENRCYLCKKDLFTKLILAAEEDHIPYVAEGSNVDDLGDYRPGLQAISELGILSPLKEAGLTKEEIRFLSRKMRLPTWDKPSFACLASRFVYGEEITREKLSMVEKAEELLLTMGFRQMRVRIHGKMARIEALPQDLPRLVREEERKRIVKSFREYGFTYVAMDLSGYRTGSMNEAIKTKTEKNLWEEI